MRNYERPVVAVNGDLAEGVFLASGDICWKYERAWKDNYRSEENAMVWHVEYKHYGNGHHSSGLEGTVTTNIPVASVKIYGGDNTVRATADGSTTVKISAGYMNGTHYVNAGGESKTFNIGFTAVDPTKTSTITVEGGSVSKCYADTDHPFNG